MNTIACRTGNTTHAIISDLEESEHSGISMGSVYIMMGML
jgi:hypothetical protein